jgi:hypothetical protein
MALGAATPEELEALIEDACVVGDSATLAELLDVAAVVMSTDGSIRRGRNAVGGLRAGGTGSACYCADPRIVLQSADLALVVSPRSLNVVQRGGDRRWRLVISVLGRSGPDPGLRSP